MKQYESNGVKYAEMTVKYLLNEKEITRLERLLTFWQQYESPDGTHPFKDWDIEKLFQALMETGSSHIIDKKIKEDEWRKELITYDQMIWDGKAGE